MRPTAVEGTGASPTSGLMMTRSAVTALIAAHNCFVRSERSIGDSQPLVASMSAANQLPRSSTSVATSGVVDSSVVRSVVSTVVYRSSRRRRCSSTRATHSASEVSVGPVAM
ncbi:Uncharacterised protein [Mycobacteroides abscessus subsp. abscessus]|nr:Uncharacterised protein [Mycobacteroides abscessus subsp. abscessus]